MPALLAALSIDGSQPLHFLVDTGATISILPPKVCVSKLVSPSPLSLLSVGGSPLKIHGECEVTLSCRELRREYNVCFIVADVTLPILGIDFLSTHNIIVNCKQSTLTDGDTGISLICKPAQRPTLTSLLLDKVPETVKSLLQKYPEVLKPLQFPMASTSNVVHHIDTTKPALGPFILSLGSYLQRSTRQRKRNS